MDICKGIDVDCKEILSTIELLLLLMQRIAIYATSYCSYLLVPARGEWDASGIGECKEGLAGDIPGIRVAAEGPETWGEPGQFPARWLGDIIVYGELGSIVPVKIPTSRKQFSQRVIW